MSWTDIRRVSIKLSSEIEDERIQCMVLSSAVKRDAYSRQILHLMLECREHGTVLSVYSPMKARALMEALQKLGIEDMRMKCFEFVRTTFQSPRPGYSDPHPSYIPVQEVECTW